jgi:hypothetical protein
VNLTSLPASHINARNRPFSTGGVGTWDYSPALVESWFDDLASGGDLDEGL